MDMASFEVAYSGVIEGNYTMTQYLSSYPGFSASLNSKLTGLSELMLGLPNNTSVKDIKKLICDYHSNNVGALSSRADVELFGSMADVLLYSAQLWLPTENGGNNVQIHYWVAFQRQELLVQLKEPLLPGWQRCNCNIILKKASSKTGYYPNIKKFCILLLDGAN